jgi:hypothetical protein
MRSKTKLFLASLIASLGALSGCSWHPGPTGDYSCTMNDDVFALEIKYTNKYNFTWKNKGSLIEEKSGSWTREFVNTNSSSGLASNNSGTDSSSDQYSVTHLILYFSKDSYGYNCWEFVIGDDTLADFVYYKNFSDKRVFIRK